jgi:hypothetical protein
VRRFADDIEAYRRKHRGDPPWSDEAREHVLRRAWQAWEAVRKAPDELTRHAMRLSPQVKRTLQGLGFREAREAVEALRTHLGWDPNAPDTYARHPMAKHVSALKRLVEGLEEDQRLGEMAEEDPDQFRDPYPRREVALEQARMLCRFFQVARADRGIVLHLVCEGAWSVGAAFGLVAASPDPVGDMVESLRQQTKPRRCPHWPPDPKPHRCPNCGGEFWGNSHSCMSRA